MAAIYSNGVLNCWNILAFNFNKRDVLSSVYKISMPLTKPVKLHNIIGDVYFEPFHMLLPGNKYTTGRQVHNIAVRQKILDYMRSIENLLRPHINMSLSDYIQSTRLATSRPWGGRSRGRQCAIKNFGTNNFDILKGCVHFIQLLHRAYNGSTKTQKHSLKLIFLGRRMKQFAPKLNKH
jgi:hypothetical protein